MKSYKIDQQINKNISNNNNRQVRNINNIPANKKIHILN